MSPALQPMAVKYYCHMPASVSRDQYTALSLERVLVTWYGCISYIYTFWYSFDTVLYVNFSRQEYQIDVLYVLFNSWDYQVSSYTPFHFSFTVPSISRLVMVPSLPSQELKGASTRGEITKMKIWKS